VKFFFNELVSIKIDATHPLRIVKPIKNEFFDTAFVFNRKNEDSIVVFKYKSSEKLNDIIIPEI
jgi:hypothetical protein